jgi:hypothetical protein
MTNIHALKPGDLLALLNSTPLCQVCDERSLRGIRQAYGLRIGSTGTVDLLKYTARLRLDRRPTADTPPTTASLYAKTREQLRQQREGTDTQSQPEVHATESQAGPITRRILDNPLWPISKELRAKVVEWLEVVLETTTDDRSRLTAIKSLIAADKLNLVLAHLELKEHLLNEQPPEPPARTPVQVNLNVEEKPKSVFERLRELEKFYASRDNQSEGPAPGRGS